MTTLSPDQEALIAAARRVADALIAVEEHSHTLRNERSDTMKRMHLAGISWAEIARTFDVTPQAAMYTTGHARRQAREKKS